MYFINNAADSVVYVFVLLITYSPSYHLSKNLKSLEKLTHRKDNKKDYIYYSVFSTKKMLLHRENKYLLYLDLYSEACDDSPKYS